MKRRAALACAFAVSPKILLLDEPFVNLDEESAQQLQRALEELRSEGCTICLATHEKTYREVPKVKRITLVEGELR